MEGEAIKHHRVKCQSGLFGAFTAKINSNRNWLAWNTIAGRDHNHTFAFAAKCALANTAVR